MTSIFNNKQEQFDALFRMYSKMIFLIALRYVGSEFDAEEVVQRSFVKIYNAIENLENRGELALKGWLSKIAVNESLLFLREQKRFQNGEEWLETGLEESIEMELDIDYELCLKLVRELPSGYRSVFNLFVIEGYSHKEIAELLGIAESASRSQLTRARNILREKIEKLYGHGKIVG